MLTYIRFHSRDRQSTRRLRDGTSIVEDILDCGTHLVGCGCNDLINVLTDNAMGFLTNARNSAAVSEQAHFIQSYTTAVFSCSEGAGSIRWFNTNNLYFGPDVLEINRHTREQPTAATWDKDVIGRSARLPRHLNANGALSSDNTRVIERVQVSSSALFYKRICIFRRLIESITLKHNICTPPAHSINFDGRRGDRHDDGRLDTQLLCRHRNTLCMIARGGSNHTSGALFS